jgi:hypothetical protein
MMRRGEGEGSFEFDGKTWTLRLDFNAMADFEAETGRPFLTTLEAMGEGTAPMGDIRLLFWAMLRDHHPDVTIRQAGRMVTSGMDALSAASLSALPSGSDAEVPDAGGPDAGGKPQAATAQAA